MKLPTEILNHILSYLRSDQAALKACIETHATLSQLAEPYLYADIILRTDDLPTDFGTSNLAKLLSDRPHLIHHIHHLVIGVVGLNKQDVFQQAEKIAAILPMLSSLRGITLRHFKYSWKELPDAFHQAFLNCLHLPSMQDVCVSRVIDFPFMVVLSGECKSITRLTVQDCSCKSVTWGQPHLEEKYDALHQNQSAPFQSLRLENCDGVFLKMFLAWVEKRGLEFRSLEILPWNISDFDALPRVISKSSNSLTSLDLDIGLTDPSAYGFSSLIVRDYANVTSIPLSSLPYLTQLTIRANLAYIPINETFVFYSPTHLIRQLFFSCTSSLTIRHVILNFDCRIKLNSRFQFPSPSTISDSFLSPLVRLLSSISGWGSLVQVDLYLRGSNCHLETGGDSGILPTSLDILLSPLSECGELMEFVERGMLFIKPCYSTA